MAAEKITRRQKNISRMLRERRRSFGSRLKASRRYPAKEGADRQSA